MIKNKWFVLGIVLALVLISLFIYNSNKKIYLSSKYYNKGEYINIDSKYFDKIKDDNYLLFTYNSYCTFKVPCENIFKEVMNKYKIDILSIPIEEFKNTKFYKEVKFGPSVMVIKKGKVRAYLDANSDKDLDIYQDSKLFEKWLKKYIYMEDKND